MDTVSGPIELLISDLKTPAPEVIVTGVSSDQTVIADADNVFESIGEIRVVTLSPQRVVIGITTITVSVSDRMAITGEDFLVTISGFEIFVPIVLKQRVEDSFFLD